MSEEPDTLIMAEHQRLGFEEAKDIIAGYAFATEKIEFRSPSPKIGDPLGDQLVPIWGYRTYDCVPASLGVDLTEHDLTVAAGLNGRIDVKAMAALQTVAGTASEALGEIPDEVRFWNLDPEGLGPEEPDRERYPVEWALQRAWFVLISALHVGPALTHKILHHKRPEVFPLLDNETLKYLPSDGRSWISIHEDVNRPAFESLEVWFGNLASNEDTVSLKRLRLHDILLWCRASGDERRAKTLGREVRQRTGDA